MKELSNLYFIPLTQKNLDFEYVERKGKGHPDTLSDNLAEELSRTYSKYTLSKFGVILHHNFDKIGLLGGKSYVAFGKGYLEKPIRVLLNGRASIAFAGKEIPVKKILENSCKTFLKEKLPLININKDVKVLFNLNNASSPGRVEEKGHKEGTRRYWFTPRGLYDLHELEHLNSNDSALGCSYAPLSITEKIVLKIEKTLNSKSYKRRNKWIGSDIKMIAFRVHNKLDITLCIPQIAKYVPDLGSYINNLERSRQDIETIIKRMAPHLKFFININTRDDFDTLELYLTATGSAIESGDEGLVGRGNRINGLITPCRPMCIEGVCGKNPVYHTGKIYNLVAKAIAERLYKE